MSAQPVTHPLLDLWVKTEKLRLGLDRLEREQKQALNLLTTPFDTIADVLAEATALTYVYGPNDELRNLDQLAQEAEEVHRYAADEDVWAGNDD